jgi:hypothetical protein
VPRCVDDDEGEASDEDVACGGSVVRPLLDEKGDAETLSEVVPQTEGEAVPEVLAQTDGEGVVDFVVVINAESVSDGTLESVVEPLADSRGVAEALLESDRLAVGDVDVDALAQTDGEGVVDCVVVVDTDGDGERAPEIDGALGDDCAVSERQAEAERLAEDLMEKDLKEGQEEKPGVDYEAIKDDIKYALERMKEAKKRHVDHLTTAEFCISTLEFFNAAAAANVSEIQTQIIMLKIFKEFKEGNDLAVTRFFKDQALRLRLPIPRHPPTWTA